MQAHILSNATSETIINLNSGHRSLPDKFHVNVRQKFIPEINNNGVFKIIYWCCIKCGLHLRTQICNKMLYNSNLVVMMMVVVVVMMILLLYLIIQADPRIRR